MKGSCRHQSANTAADNADSVHTPFIIMRYLLIEISVIFRLSRFQLTHSLCFSIDSSFVFAIFFREVFFIVVLTIFGNSITTKSYENGETICKQSSSSSEWAVWASPVPSSCHPANISSIATKCKKSFPSEKPSNECVPERYGRTILLIQSDKSPAALQCCRHI
eukprot:NP_497883.1 Uncharacterized protein CELE_B0284.3 [Caenorhabditis elegans]